PLDLLRVARTSKDLRSVLMSRKSIIIWKQSRLNIEGLPECPEDPSEPQYAYLTFDSTCYV
ncbi:hypothetical protein BDZ97DRAFT_1612907, partial [Flammula alnicola]